MTSTSTTHMNLTRWFGRAALGLLVIGILGSSLSTASAFGKRSKPWQKKAKTERVKIRAEVLPTSSSRKAPTASYASSTTKKAKPERKRLFSRLREKREKREKARAVAAARRPAPKPVAAPREPVRVRATATAKPKPKPVKRSTKKKREGLLVRMFKPMKKKTDTANVAVARETKKRVSRPSGPVAPNANQSAPRYNESLLSQSRSRGGNVVVNIAQQRARLYVGGQVALDTPISTARSGKRTPRGSFSVGQRVRQGKISTIYKVEMPYWMRLGQSAYGMHAGYLPGYPASAGCIRMPYQAAQKLYDATSYSTRVRITGG